MIVQKYRKCKICERIGGVFITRQKLLASGKLAVYPDNVCTLCANEQARDRYYKMRSDPVRREKERLRLLTYKRNNPEKTKESARLYWLKNRVEIQKRRNLKKAIKEAKPRKRNSHHRIPTNRDTYGKFDFRLPSTIRRDAKLCQIK